jgi:hypothetical protein
MVIQKKTAAVISEENFPNTNNWTLTEKPAKYFVLWKKNNEITKC